MEFCTYICTHSLYRSPNIVRVIESRRMRLAGHVSRMEESRSAFIILTGKPTEKRPLGRSRRRWEDNIRMDINQSSANDVISRHAIAVMHSDQ